MDGARNIHSEQPRKKNVPCFLQFVDAIFESSDMFASLGILIENMRNIRGQWRGGFQRRGNPGIRVKG